jgi:hypothetical protein
MIHEYEHGTQKIIIAASMPPFMVLNVNLRDVRGKR